MDGLLCVPYNPVHSRPNSILLTGYKFLQARKKNIYSKLIKLPSSQRRKVAAAVDVNLTSHRVLFTIGLQIQWGRRLPMKRAVLKKFPHLRFVKKVIAATFFAKVATTKKLAKNLEDVHRP